MHTNNSTHSQTKTKVNVYLGKKLALPWKLQNMSEHEGKPAEQHMGAFKI